MEKKTEYFLLVIIILLILGLIIFFSSIRKPQISSIPAPKPIIIIQKAPVKPKKSVSAQIREPRVEKPRTMIFEKRIWGGNKGYIIRDGEYVYFGTFTILRQEVPVE